MECTSEGLASIFLAIFLLLSEALPYVSKLYGKDLTKYNGVLHTITALIKEKCITKNENIASATPTPDTVEINIDNLKNQNSRSVTAIAAPKNLQVTTEVDEAKS